MMAQPSLCLKFTAQCFFLRRPFARLTTPEKYRLKIRYFCNDPLCDKVHPYTKDSEFFEGRRPGFDYRKYVKSLSEKELVSMRAFWRKRTGFLSGEIWFKENWLNLTVPNNANHFNIKLHDTFFTDCKKITGFGYFLLPRSQLFPVPLSRPYYMDRKLNIPPKIEKFSRLPLEIIGLIFKMLDHPKNLYKHLWTFSLINKHAHRAMLRFRDEIANLSLIDETFTLDIKYNYFPILGRVKHETIFIPKVNRLPNKRNLIGHGIYLYNNFKVNVKFGEVKSFYDDYATIDMENNIVNTPKGSVYFNNGVISETTIPLFIPTMCFGLDIRNAIANIMGHQPRYVWFQSKYIHTPQGESLKSNKNLREITSDLIEYQIFGYSDPIINITLLQDRSKIVKMIIKNHFEYDAINKEFYGENNNKVIKIKYTDHYDVTIQKWHDIIFKGNGSSIEFLRLSDFVPYNTNHDDLGYTCADIIRDVYAWCR